MIKNKISLKTKLFKGFADESRLSILELLVDGYKCVSNLVEKTGLSQPNVSAHLKCLEECGLITSKRKWRNIYYSITDKKICTILKDSEVLIEKNEQKISSCLNYSQINSEK